VIDCLNAARTVTPEHDTAAYCREIESHLCRKNDGHLIRIVGPAFAMVSGWASQGIPLKVACRGIDRCVERHQAKGPRRRPVQVAFCEADVLDAFDEWRRAVGIGRPGRGAEPEEHDAASADPAARDASERRFRAVPLTRHLSRVIERLAFVDPGFVRPPALEQAVADLVAELASIQDAAARLRGEARSRVLVRLAALDAQLMAVAETSCDEAARRDVEARARDELRSYEGRLSSDALEAARRRAAARQLRERLKLPVVRLD
jgi:hypothetical protein